MTYGSVVRREGQVLQLPEHVRLERQDHEPTFTEVMQTMQARNKMEAAKPLLQVRRCASELATLGV